MTKYNPDVYNNEWVAKRTRFHSKISKITNWFIKEYGPFESSLDLGAGDGWYSYILSTTGTDAYAVELHKWNLPYLPTKNVNCITYDLRKPLDLGRKFDLVLCIEVAEHLPESVADILCDTVARHCGKLLVFTAALPGQGGKFHINEQPRQYWKERLAKRGLIYSPKGTTHVSEGWKTILRGRMRWLYTNVMLYRFVENVRGSL